jgi:hypothetical protein
MHLARKSESPFSPILFQRTTFAFPSPYIDSDRVLSKSRSLPIQYYASASKRPLINIFKLSSSLQLHRIYDFRSVCAGGSSCHPIPQVRRRVPRSPESDLAGSAKPAQSSRRQRSVLTRTSCFSPFSVRQWTARPDAPLHVPDTPDLSPRECECSVISTDRFSFSVQG